MKLIKCPTCKKETIYSTENLSRPFCSERCKLIDLGEWADESFKIPISAQHNDDETNELNDDSWSEFSKEFNKKNH